MLFTGIRYINRSFLSLKLSLDMSNDFLNFPLYVIAFGCANLQLSGSQSRKRKKWRRCGGGTTWHLIFKSPESYSIKERRSLQPPVVKTATVSAHLWASTTTHRSLNQPVENRPPVCGGQDSYCPPWHPQATCKVLWEHTHGCPPWAMAWGKGHVALFGTGTKFSAVYHPRPPWHTTSFQETPDFQRSPISQMLPLKGCPGRESQSPGASCTAGWTLSVRS